MTRTQQKLPPFNKAATSLAKTQLLKRIIGKGSELFLSFESATVSCVSSGDLNLVAYSQRCLLERASQGWNPELRSRFDNCNAVLVQRAVRLQHVESVWRRSGQSVTASDFGSNGPRFESGRGRCVESLDKALYSHCPKEKPSH